MEVYKKVLQGTFHQGHVMFGETAGRQCSCCSLFAICFTLVKSPGHWNSCDLDFILREGDTLYKAQNTMAHLMATQLPKFVAIFGSDVKINLLENKFGFVSYKQMSSFLLRPSQAASNGLILFMKGVCIAVMWTSKAYFLFDSHSKDSNGSVAPDGFSILIKFDKKADLEYHISSVYLNESDFNIQFESQHILAQNVENIDLSCKYRREKSRVRNSNKNAKEKRKIRQNTDQAKTNCRKRKSSDKEISNCKKRNTCVVKKIRKVNEKHDFVSTFLHAIKNGPYFICIVCHRCLYRKTVKLFHEGNYSENVKHIFNHVASYDSKFYICLTCDRHLVKDNIPCQAVWNKLELTPLPKEIEILNKLEKVLISKRILFKKIVIMPKGQQPKINGAICNVPIRADKVHDCLPNGMDSNGLVFVKLKRKLMFRGHGMFYLRVFAQMLFLVPWSILSYQIHFIQTY